MKLILSKSAHKQYLKLSQPAQNKIKKKLSLLLIDHNAGKKLVGELKGKLSLRAWPYRIVYSINDKQKQVEILQIIHRQSAYKK